MCIRDRGNFLKTSEEAKKKTVDEQAPTQVGAHRDKAKAHSLSPLANSPAAGAESSDKAGHGRKCACSYNMSRILNSTLVSEFVINLYYLHYATTDSCSLYVNSSC